MAPWTLKRLERAVENFSAQLQCAICLCAYDNPVSLPCNHCFCEECIHRALELKALCPICKTPAKKRRLRYDTTVQELLRATEMLCAAPDPTAAALAAPAAPQTPITTPKKAEEKRPSPEVKKEPATHVKVAAPAAKVAADAAKAKAATPERKTTPRRASPRRVTKRNSQKSPPSTPTLMDMWVSGGSMQLKNGLKIKKEKGSTPMRRASPRRALTQEMNSQVAASQLSPALFEISAPRDRSSNGANGETKDDGVDGKMLNRRRRSDTDAGAMDTTTDTAVDETQMEVTEPNMQQVSPRRRRSATTAITMNTDATSEPVGIQLEGAKPKEEPTLSRRRRLLSDTGESAVDAVVAETQLEVVEMEQHEIPALRWSTTDAVTTQDDAQLESAKPQKQQAPGLQLRSATNLDIMDVPASDTQLVVIEPKHQAPTLRKRVRSDTNGITVVADAATAKKNKIEQNQLSLYNEKVAFSNGPAETSSLVIDSRAQPLPEIEVFQVGDLVDVIERQWIGINKRGGAGRITKVHGDGFYAVKFVIGSGTDNRVPGFYIRRPAEDLVSDSTPSRAVRKRQRRRPSDIMVSPDLLSTKTKSSPHSTEKIKMKSKTDGKRSGMVFLCSGFKEDRMQQIGEWAELLGAEVVHYWSNDVTHLIVKCVSGGDLEEENPSMDDSDSSESSPQGQKGGKRKLFGGDPKSGRWVKIRSLKYLKALVGGRWIVSDEWLQACADHGGYVSEVNYEADGHWKGRRIHDAVKRSRLTREKLLQLSSLGANRSNIGTMLFADFCFHVIGEFLPPMPPITELNTLICMGGGKLIAFMDQIPDEMHKRENRLRKLIIVSDKINPIALRQQTRQLKVQPQMKAVSSATIVNYLWVINSISEAKLRELP
ncbi:hypothetical protein PHYPSEUDO_000338 [Phytophthora pseudosyringae]|uniref:RING-type E3 ubiquitin transferase BRCA1 n=1 Tax=Phytophthora pseudosyringae TaxID=221518 RepID=A0A8T1W2X4_9STRA|nr:hypothetical protein PHYPSEUDO_000338 [Phytophthora pseudosyringae]